LIDKSRVLIPEWLLSGAFRSIAIRTNGRDYDEGIFHLRMH